MRILVLLLLVSSLNTYALAEVHAPEPAAECSAVIPVEYPCSGVLLPTAEAKNCLHARQVAIPLLNARVKLLETESRGHELAAARYREALEENRRWGEEASKVAEALRASLYATEERVDELQAWYRSPVISVASFAIGAALAVILVSAI